MPAQVVADLPSVVGVSRAAFVGFSASTWEIDSAKHRARAFSTSLEVDRTEHCANQPLVVAPELAIA